MEMHIVWNFHEDILRTVAYRSMPDRNFTTTYKTTKKIKPQTSTGRHKREKENKNNDGLKLCYHALRGDYST